MLGGRNLCAQYGYDQTFLTCNTAVGNTTTATVTGSTGAAKPTDPNPVTTPVGTSKAMLCNEVVDCVLTHCAAGGFPTLSACYCGTASQGDCNNGLGNGKCKAEIERALRPRASARSRSAPGKRCTVVVSR